LILATQEIRCVGKSGENSPVKKKFQAENHLSELCFLHLIQLHLHNIYTLSLKANIIIIISPLQSTAGHTRRPLQFLAISLDPWLLASSSCQPFCANHHSTWSEGVLHCAKIIITRQISFHQIDLDMKNITGVIAVCRHLSSSSSAY
jgi:hypothetical protein